MRVTEPPTRATAFGGALLRVPRGYVPLVTGRSLRRGDRERSERESKLCWQVNLTFPIQGDEGMAYKIRLERKHPLNALLGILFISQYGFGDASFSDLLPGPFMLKVEEPTFSLTFQGRKKWQVRNRFKEAAGVLRSPLYSPHPVRPSGWEAYGVSL